MYWQRHSIIIFRDTLKQSLKCFPPGVGGSRVLSVKLCLVVLLQATAQRLRAAAADVTAITRYLHIPDFRPDWTVHGISQLCLFNL